MSDQPVVSSGSTVQDVTNQAQTPPPDQNNPPATQPTQGVQNTTSQDQPDQNPQSSQTNQTPQTPQGATADSQVAQQPKQGTQTAPSAPAGPAQHPSVTMANRVHDIAQTLAGGPSVSYKIDPNTGEMKATQTPLSGRSIAQAIAISLLSGAAAGAGEKGPGYEGRAASAGFQAAQQQAQQQKQAAQQQASQDYARQAAITTTNFQTHQNALRLSQMELDYHKQFVDTAAPVLKNLTDVGAVQATNVAEDDLLSKYHVAKDMAIPDGTVVSGKNPDGSDHYENTYTVIDPSKKITLPEDTAKLLADLHINGYYTMKDGKAVPTDFAGSAGVKAGLVVNGLAIAQGFQITEAQMNKQLAKLGDPDAAQQFDVNLKKAVSDGSISQKGLQTLAGYANMVPDLAVAAMEKDKVDPQIIQAYRQLVPQEAIDKSKMDRENAEADRKAAETRKNLEITPKNAEDVINAKSGLYTPEQVASAKAIQQYADNHDVSVAGRKSAAEASARTQAEINVKKANNIPITGAGKGIGGEDLDSLSHPELSKYVQDPSNYDTPDGTNQAFLQAMMKTDPERAKLIQAYSKGMDIQSYYAAVKKFGGSVAADIHSYDPTFNASQMRTYDKTIQEYSPSGKLGIANKAASTAFKHLHNLHDSTNAASSLGLSGTNKEDAALAISEMGNAYSNGHKAGEAELEDQRKALHSNAFWIAKDATVRAASGLMEKVKSDYASMDDSLPKGVRRPGLIDADGANSYHALTGKKVDINLIKAPKDATGVAPDKATGVLHYHDEKGNDKGVVPGQQ